MHIASGPDKFSKFKITNLRNDHYEQGIRSNIKRYAEKSITTSLIKLARQFTIGYIKLEETMARRKSSFCHLLDVRNIPSRNNYSTRVWRFFDHLNCCTYLI